MAFDLLSSNFDQNNGGFAKAPKFIMGHQLQWLLRYWQSVRNPQALAMVETTAQKIALGGIYDWIGGGFHRYATDEQWQVPHFEKMLYDQAMVSKIYLELYQVTQNPFYKTIAEEILNYVLRDLTDPSGGFYSAEDADSLEYPEDLSIKPPHHLKKEGAFYVWGHQEIKELLTAEEYRVFCNTFNIDEQGNVSLDPHGEFANKNILYVDTRRKEFNLEAWFTQDHQVLESAKRKLFQHRSTRPRPFLDDKILLDWNALMISSFAIAGAILDHPPYIQAAEKACHFILNKMVSKEGRLYHRFRENIVGINAFLDDYAALILALLDLFQVTSKKEFFNHALRLSVEMVEHFWDEPNGAFYQSAKDVSSLISRPKEYFDGALPSGNALAAQAVARIWHLTQKEPFEEVFKKLNAFYQPMLAQHPHMYAGFLLAADYVVNPKNEIICLSNDTSSLTEISRSYFSHFLPRTFFYAPSADSQNQDDDFNHHFPHMEGKGMQGERVCIYVCSGRACQQPLLDHKAFPSKLDDLTRS
ncbi:MAG: thioredoxin domain-containing protein [Candidatus Omnitrophica bacterium]|nr:thioredoxin domain-containing protein [Candidatus Omnitrophota bacterium]